jgi:hypothetical protein
MGRERRKLSRERLGDLDGASFFSGNLFAFVRSIIKLHIPFCNLHIASIFNLARMYIQIRNGPDSNRDIW